MEKANQAVFQYPSCSHNAQNISLCVDERCDEKYGMSFCIQCTQEKYHCFENHQDCELPYVLEEINQALIGMKEQSKSQQNNGDDLEQGCQRDLQILLVKCEKIKENFENIIDLLTSTTNYLKDQLQNNGKGDKLEGMIKCFNNFQENLTFDSEIFQEFKTECLKNLQFLNGSVNMDIKETGKSQDPFFTKIVDERFSIENQLQRICFDIDELQCFYPLKHVSKDIFTEEQCNFDEFQSDTQYQTFIKMLINENQLLKNQIGINIIEGSSDEEKMDNIRFNFLCQANKNCQFYRLTKKSMWGSWEELEQTHGNMKLHFDYRKFTKGLDLKPEQMFEKCLSCYSYIQEANALIKSLSK